MSVESTGLIQHYYDSLPCSERSREKFRQWTPFVLHSHAMVADMRTYFMEQGFTEKQALQEVLWPEAKQPITSRIQLLQQVYGNMFGSALPIHFSDHAAHPLIANVYDDSPILLRCQYYYRIDL